MLAITDFLTVFSHFSKKIHNLFSPELDLRLPKLNLISSNERGGLQKAPILVLRNQNSKFLELPLIKAELRYQDNAITNAILSYTTYTVLRTAISISIINILLCRCRHTS